jgi:hypothetical protein
MPRELRLVVQPDERRQVGCAHTAQQQLLGARDAQMRQIRVRRHSHLRTKRAAQMKLVELRVRRKIVELDRVSEVLAQVLQSIPPRTDKPARARGGTTDA